MSAFVEGCTDLYKMTEAFDVVFGRYGLEFLMSLRVLTFYGVLAGLLCLSVSPVWAQESVDVQNFQPELAPKTVFSTEGSGVFKHMEAGAGLWLNYASRPLLVTLQNEAGVERDLAVVNQQLALHLMAGVGLFGRFQLDFNVPVYAVNEGDSSGLYPNGGGKIIAGGVGGDVSLRLKGNILSSDGADSRFGLAMALEVSLPSGDETAFVGESGPTLLPSVIADFHMGSVLVALNTGVLIRSEEDVRNIKFGPELRYKLGAEWRVLDDMVGIGGELFGRTQFASADQGSLELNGSPLEYLLGVKLYTPSGVSVSTAAGAGLISGYGSTDFRAVVGVAYTPMPKRKAGALDTDGDGILDTEDACPSVAEDKDGFQDEDGCADLDNDGDGIPDEQDKCSNEAEDQDGFKDDDGCPDPDNDGDGVLDINDKCPNKKGVASDGCPLAKAQVRVFKRIKLREQDIQLLEKIFFEFDKAVIESKSYPLLDEISELLKQYPQIKLVEIGGHTDTEGKDEYNKELSDRRAAAVLKYLLNKGVEAERLTSKGYGEEALLIKPEKSKDDAAKNRRVEFQILKQTPIKTPVLETKKLSDAVKATPPSIKEARTPAPK